MYYNTAEEFPETIGSIDSRCNIIDSVVEEQMAVATAFGFTIKNSRLYPVSTCRRLQWLRSVQEVFTNKEPQYVVVQDLPKLCCALLSVDPNTNVVKVSMSRSQVCRAETTERFGELMGFTKREKEVVRLLSQGCDTDEVAHILGTKISTVRTQIKSVTMKSGISGIKNFLVFLSCLPEPPDSEIRMA